ncbi:MAG: helix-turn-helix transcriptional regulator [Segetibacter sp.]
MTLFIKNMVSIRCKMLVKAELEALDLHPMVVELGEVTIKENISVEKQQCLKIALLESGLELMDDKKIILFQKIKNEIIEMIHYSDELPEINFSDYLSKKLNCNYICLSNLFSEVKGTTIENYVIAHKIERVKELLVHDKLTLTDIAYKLHYSSVAHLSNQFKKVTGLTASFLKT